MSERETPEQATRRWRWITLAEVVAVAGVVIGALTLYSNAADRRADEAARATEQSAAAQEKARVDLVATVTGGGSELTLSDEKHELTDAVVAFPKALGVAAQRPPGDPVIDADWFDDVLLKLTDGGADAKTGRLPVLVTVSYVDGDATRTATGLYDVVWRTEGHLLRGRTLKLDSLRLRQRGAGQAALDAAWAREKPSASHS